MWLWDPRSTLVPANSENNLYVVMVIAGLPWKADFAFGLSQVNGVTKRIGYSNTFNWTPNYTNQHPQPITVIESDCQLACEGVAVYNEHGFKKVLVPGCGNLPY